MTQFTPIPEGVYAARVADFVQQPMARCPREYLLVTLELTETRQRTSYAVFGFRNAAKLALACGFPLRDYDTTLSLVRKCFDQPLCVKVRVVSAPDGLAYSDAQPILLQEATS